MKDSRFDGTITGIELPDIIQLNSLSKTTTTLVITTVDEQGTIYFQDGEVVHAQCGDLEGEKAFYRILGFDGGRIESKESVSIPKKTIQTAVAALLIEGARRDDEAGLQPGGTKLECAADIDDIEIDFEPSSLVDVPDEGMVQVKRAVGSHPSDSTNTTGTKEEAMSTLKDLLAEFTNIPGVNTACLVGRDGFLVEDVTMAGVDSEMVGAIASSGFGASEAMGTQLEKGALSLSMIEYENGPVMLAPVGDEAFLVIVADRSSNLGMIRLKIKKHAKEIREVAAI